MPPLRLQRYLAQAGIASRRHAEELIAAGSVKVNGKVVNTPGVMVAERDRVEVEGKRALRVDPIYRILLKPRACLASLAPAGERTTLRRYVRDAEPGLAVVAPLDFPAEGVILLTTDGELADAISKRGQKVPMTYHLKFQGAVGEGEIERLMRGWRWEQVPVRPTAITSLATTGKNTWVEVVVAEIRPRALKAAGDLIRHSVLKISRVRLGRLSFEGLEMGGWRDLSKSELGDLRQSAGLSKGTSAAEPDDGPFAKPKPMPKPASLARPKPFGRPKPFAGPRSNGGPSPDAGPNLDDRSHLHARAKPGGRSKPYSKPDARPYPKKSKQENPLRRPTRGK